MQSASNYQAPGRRGKSVTIFFFFVQTKVSSLTLLLHAAMKRSHRTIKNSFCCSFRTIKVHNDRERVVKIQNGFPCGNPHALWIRSSTKDNEQKNCGHDSSAPLITKWRINATRSRNVKRNANCFRRQSKVACSEIKIELAHVEMVLRWCDAQMINWIQFSRTVASRKSHKVNYKMLRSLWL